MTEEVPVFASLQSLAMKVPGIKVAEIESWDDVGVAWKHGDLSSKKVAYELFVGREEAEARWEIAGAGIFSHIGCASLSESSERELDIQAIVTPGVFVALFEQK